MRKILSMILSLLLLFACSCEKKKTFFGDEVPHQWDFAETYDQYLELASQGFDENAITYEQIKSVGEFVRCQFCCDGYCYSRYYLTDENGFTAELTMVSFEAHPGSSKINSKTFKGYVSEGLIKREIEHSTDDFRVYMTDRTIDRVEYSYVRDGNLDSIYFYNQYYRFQVYAENLHDYPTDGEETFISRLLDSTSATEAAAELKEKILAAKGAEE